MAMSFLESVWNADLDFLGERETLAKDAALEVMIRYFKGEILDVEEDNEDDN